jgi:hypothetical protein
MSDQTRSVCSTPGDAIQLLTTDRDVWKAKALKAEAEVKRLAFRLEGKGGSICPTNPTDVHPPGLGSEHCVSCLQAEAKKLNGVIYSLGETMKQARKILR